MQLVLDTKGITVRKRNGCLQILSKEHERIISPAKISSIAITTHCGLSSSAIRLAIEHRVPIYFIDSMGNVEGQICSASFGHLSTLRRKQVFFYNSPEATNWVINLLKTKCEHQNNHLRWLVRNHPSKLDITESFISRNDLNILQFSKGHQLNNCADVIRGNEGIYSRNYWQTINEILPETWKFKNRNRHPAEDPFNAGINYCYGMLYTYVETALFSVGLDPYLGFFHADQYDKPTLSYDLIEPFRPWADQLLTDLIFTKRIEPTHFEVLKGGVCISKTGKSILIPSFHQFFNEKVDFMNGRTTRKNHIYRYAGQLVEILKKFEIK
jgi:CRISPR-associated protein Cas1